MAKRKPARGRAGALRLYADVIGLNHLHYGLWDGDPATLDGLKAAQDRYTEHLIGLIDPGVKRILDCGCGIGSTSLELKSRGYDVEGLTPDAYQKERFEERTGLTCHQARFQDFFPEKPYDLVLMSESCGYIPIEQVFPALDRTVKGGLWLLADAFRLCEGDSPLNKSGHLLDEFLARCDAAGLSREYEEDITERVIPTLELAHDFIEQKARPSAQMLNEYLSDRYPRLYPPLFKLARFFARKAEAKIERQMILLDSTAYRKAKCYMVYKFSVP